MGRRHGRTEGEGHVLAEVLEDLSLAVFVVTPRLEVVMTNSAARALADESDSVAVRHGQLRIGENGQFAELVRAVARSAEAPREAGAAHWVASIDRADRSPLHVYVRGVSDDRVVVYVVDPEPALPNCDLLRTLFRFSPAETRVALELLHGHSVERVAGVLSLSVHTVRAHLKNLFAKTGVRRQAELMQLITSSMGCLRIGPQNPSFEGCADAGDPVRSVTSSESPETS